ncbi:MAG: HAD-IC family P-type ATPase, partial [Planctomycetota bacterium]
VFVGWQQTVQGCFAFEEQLRADATSTMAALKKLQIKTRILSGDHDARVARVAERLQMQASGGQLPEDKQAVVQLLQQQGHRVAMVGDGLNDAPSLGLADVGIALGCGVEVTRDAADVCLMSSRLSTLPWAISLARRTKRTVARNLLWSLIYNVIGITLAATGRLNPMVASLAMVLSSGFVIVESLRLTSVEAPEANVADLPHPAPALSPPGEDLEVAVS